MLLLHIVIVILSFTITMLTSDSDSDRNWRMKSRSSMHNNYKHIMSMSMVALAAAALATPAAFAFESPRGIPTPPPRRPREVCSRRRVLGEGLAKMLGAAAAGGACLAAGTLPSRPALAAEEEDAPPPPPQPRRELPRWKPAAHFDAEYDDRLHRGCDRRIEVDPTPVPYGDGQRGYAVSFSGTDVGPKGIGPIVEIACTEETIAKYELRSWSFEGMVNEAGTEIDAGDGVHVGKWHASTEAQAWEGIKWADGNRWVVKEKEPPN